jgi:hypothetical protein
MSNANDFTTFQPLLKSALRRVAPEFFNLPVAGGDTVVRERHFCYELYSQLRSEMAASKFLRKVHAEVDKSAHPFIKNNAKLDFIVHEPGTMDCNICVIEVKPIGGEKAGFEKDVYNLKEFVASYHYHAGVLVVFGDAKDAVNRMRALVGEDFEALRAQGIYVFWQPGPGADASVM